MSERPARKPPAQPASPLDATLATLGARRPSVDEVAAIRALMRGHADPIQQQRAMTYFMVEICHVGAAPFSGENTHGSAFRAGSLAAGIALAQIADAVLMSFPRTPDQ